MDRRRVLIRGIDEYERALDAISLNSDESDENSVVDSEIDVADDLDEYVSSGDASGSEISGMFCYAGANTGKMLKKTFEASMSPNIIMSFTSINELVRL